MTEQTNTTNGEPTESTLRFDRRRLMQTIGAGAALATIGTGAVVASEHEKEEGDRAKEGDTANDEGPNGDQSGPDVHPVFGFSALSSEVAPPIEPDHTIEAHTRPREDREVPEFFFEPTGLFVEPGDTVQVVLATPHHSVTAYHPAQGIQQRVPDGVPPFSSPVLPVGAYWLYTFDTPGVYDVHCGPHELFGHVARLVVGEPTGPGAQPVPEPEMGPEEEGPVPNGTEDDEYEPEDGDEDAGKGHEHEHDEDQDDHGHDHDHEHGHEDDETDGKVPNEATDEDDSENGDDGPAPENGGGPMLRPPIGAAATVLGDPSLDPDQIVERGTVSWDEIDEANKEIPL